MKSMMKTIVFVACSLFCLNSMVASAEQAVDMDKTVNYLFVESAKSAEITKDKDKSVGNYRVTLNGVEPWVVYFSDRPKRDMGFMPIEDFITKMKNEGEKFSPKGLNVALVSLDDKKKMVNYVFTLHNPQYDAPRSRLFFTAKAVPGKTVTIIPPEVELKHVALFIDACPGCVP